MPRTLFVRFGASSALFLCSLVLAPLQTRAEAPRIEVREARVRILLPNVPPAAFFVVRNDTAETLHLTDADSTLCGRMTIHRTVTEGGVASMQMLDAVAVPAHGIVRFEPGGMHLMCMRPGASGSGTDVPVILRFAGGRTLRVPFAVRVGAP